ncbi:MAG: hypothetical protein HY556_04595 [Euryarchaeota archaeon]|nr:hypothetical protein [Euryarchaeota archaeon]
MLHFQDPSYPLFTTDAAGSLRRVGFPPIVARSYWSYVKAIDVLKEAVPASAVPETNWFLARLIQVALDWWNRPPSLLTSRESPVLADEPKASTPDM